MVGVLNSNVGNNNNHPASPSSAGFGKSGLGFGRIESSNTINNTAAPVQPYLMEKRKKASSANVPSSPVTGTAVNGTIGRGPPPLPTTAAPSHPGRRLGSFNSLAVSQNNTALKNNSKEVSRAGEEKGRPQNDHPLSFEWVFWVLHRAPTKKMSEEEFGRAMRRLGSCDTVSHLYSVKK